MASHWYFQPWSRVKVRELRKILSEPTAFLVGEVHRLVNRGPFWSPGGSQFFG